MGDGPSALPLPVNLFTRHFSLPFGARGVGETPIVPPAAAIANAIYRATGKRLNELPMTPARILEALEVI